MNKIFVAAIVLLGVACAYAQRNIIGHSVDQVPDCQIISLETLDEHMPTFEDLCKKVTFTHFGLTCFFKHVYNCEQYAQDVLPYAPFQHLEEFLNHGTKTNQSNVYTKAVFKLFDKKLKAAPFITAVSFVEFTRKLADLVQKDLNKTNNKKTDIKNTVRAELENNFDILKADPDQFLDILAEKIIELDMSAKNISRDNLCVTITRFLDTCISKITWSPEDKDLVWKSFFEIGQELTRLHAKGIIRNTDDLDDCQWSLVTRLNYFLSLASSRMPRNFFEKAGSDIVHGIAHFDSLVEQEELMTTKTQYLRDTLVASARRSDAGQYAREVGILPASEMLI